MTAGLAAVRDGADRGAVAAAPVRHGVRRDRAAGHQPRQRSSGCSARWTGWSGRSTTAGSRSTSPAWASRRRPC
ncbi:MAG: hypothetical protein M0C28_13235 [Candidatus Moduliflexus flocculans]|nr:hypothetical protein [Candidatus Moduliflexus flocculans]